jgi:hypothetical protein
MRKDKKHVSEFSDQEIVKLWRERCFGRLYWRYKNRRWYRTWEQGEVARAIDGSASMLFFSRKAILQVIGVLPEDEREEMFT